MELELSQDMKDQISAYVEIAKYVTPQVEDAYGVAILQEIGKDSRCGLLIDSRTAEKNVNNDKQPATQKQIDYLKTLGVNVTQEMSKKKASCLIDEATRGST